MSEIFPAKLVDRLLTESLSDGVLSTDDEAYTVAAAPDSGGGLTLESLELVIELMGSMPPMPVALWFIDRDAEHYQLMNLLPQIQNPIDQLMSLPVRQWSLKEIEERVKELIGVDGRDEEYCRKIFPFRTAGLWVEMSNGEHYEIELPYRPG